LVKPSTASEPAELVCQEADCSAANARRARYPAFRRQHLFVGGQP
jgi:hypothetical protein